MPATPRLLLFLLPAITALGGCGLLGHHGDTAPGTPVYSGSSVAPSAAPGAMASTGPRLSASEAFALLANNTVVGLTDAGTTYMVYFGNNGAVHFRENTIADTGSWRVLPNGEVCSELPSLSRGAETCFVLARYDDVILYQRPDGLALGSIRVIAGNPQNL